MIDLVYYQTNLLFSDIALLYYYINLRSSIIFCFSSGNIYLSLSCLFVIVSELFCGNLLETFVILLAILLPIKSPVASAVSGIIVFEVIFSASIADCLA